MRHVCAVVSVAALVACSCLTAAHASAQDAAPRLKWHIEVHAGGSLTSGGAAGTAIDQFPVGTPIPTGGGTFTSRAVSSWYFGDGARLFDDASARLGVTSRLAPLDEVLTTAAARRQNAAVFGLRIGRDLTTRFAAEFSFDYAQAGLRLTDDAREVIENARSSFTSAWEALLATGPTFRRTVTSEAEIGSGTGHELTFTGALKVRLPPVAALDPYLTAGAGVVLDRGTLPSATLTGAYAFRFADVFPVNERDTVRVKIQNADSIFVGLLGAGADYNLSRRYGIRGDVRLQFVRNELETFISTSPSVTLQEPGFAVSTLPSPSIQFSNSTLFNRPSSLSAPAVTDLLTFEGTGTRVVTSVTVGWYIRF